MIIVYMIICVGDYSYWDSKITTFPGLYIVGNVYAIYFIWNVVSV